MMEYFCFESHALGFLLLLLSFVAHTSGVGQVIWAVNCGGETHTDIHGIRYQRDPNPIGIASDYGKSLMIRRVVPQDQILYQTERYHHSTFGYDVPIQQDGDHILVLKFSEVWFTASNQKVFDVLINGVHTVVENLDIYAKVGRGTAHDEIIPFTVKNGKLKVQGESSKIEGGRMSLEFVKGERDNPKINGIFVMRGTIDDVPKLAPLPGVEKKDMPIAEDEDTGEEETEDQDTTSTSKKNKKVRRPSSGPKVQDPYAADDTGSMMLPVFVAICAFIPLLFCLCRL